MSDCSVCYEKLNKSTCKKIVCQCEYIACRECVKIYLLGQTADAHCMSCKVQWSRKFLSDNFEKSWMSKTYKKYRENVLFERELAMLPATQIYVEQEIKIEKMEMEIVNIDSQIKELVIKKKNIQNKIIKKYGQDILVERREFIRQCPNSNCHGFLSSQLKCNICEHWACGDCREVKGITHDAEHICNKDIIETVKMMKKDTKPCPKCSSMIYRSSGCLLMWCTQCKTFFDWKTLKIETRELHNPEYIDYLRKQTNGKIRRERGDIVLCGRELDNHFIQNFKYKSKELLEIIRNVIHIQRVELRRFMAENIELKHRQLRIDYMRQRINKDQLKNIIQKKEKENQKKNEVLNVLTMYIQCVTDIMYRINNADQFQVYNIINEINGLREYVNNCFMDIKNSYNCKLWGLNDKFVFI